MSIWQEDKCIFCQKKGEVNLFRCSKKLKWLYYDVLDLDLPYYMTLAHKTLKVHIDS